MKDICILCDFDGTITEKDGLYGFFEQYAQGSWREIEKLWIENKISSKECLIREFEAVPDLSPGLIDKYLKTVKIDRFFKEFYDYAAAKGIDFYIASDGADYFIEKTLENYGIKGIKIISNHFEFKNGKFSLSFPNTSAVCLNNAGTCKCSALKRMKTFYKKVIYIGDGFSDFCVCSKADKLFAKGRLIKYCSENSINCIEFKNFNDIIKNIEAEKGSL